MAKYLARKLPNLKRLAQEMELRNDLKRHGFDPWADKLWVSRNKMADRSECERAVGACVKGEYVKKPIKFPRGGVIPAASRS